MALMVYSLSVIVTNTKGIHIWRADEDMLNHRHLDISKRKTSNLIRHDISEIQRRVHLCQRIGIMGNPVSVLVVE